MRKFFVLVAGLSALHAAGAHNVNIFPIAGQTNAESRGVLSQSPTAPTGHTFECYTDPTTGVESLQPLVDPVQPNPRQLPGQQGFQNLGTMWPAFGALWYSLTGHDVVVCSGAFYGAGLSSWSDPKTTYTTDLVARVNGIEAVIAAKGDTWTIPGVIWNGGETDAVDTTVPDSQKAQTFHDRMVKWQATMRAALGKPTLLIFIVSLDDVPTSESGYAAIRAGQKLAATVPGIYMATSYSNFAMAGQDLPNDATHWNQFERNAAGYNTALTIATTLGLYQY